MREIEEKTQTLLVAAHHGGVVPRFERSTIEPAHDRLIAEMRAAYEGGDVPPYLDQSGRDLLSEGRETFRDWNLDAIILVQEEADLHLLLWRGTQATAVFGAVLSMAGLECEVHDLGLILPNTKGEEVAPILEKLVTMEKIDPMDVAEFVKYIGDGRFRESVPEWLARKQWADQNASLIRTVPTMAKAVLTNATSTWT